jgi:hypothetical protein
MENNRGNADTPGVRKLLVVSLLLLVPLLSLSAWRILYAEEYYQLYHEHLHHYPDDTMEDIYYLETALKADFANPLYALTPIKDKTEWERYRDLFSMHLNLKLIACYLTLGNKYDKMVAWFYNAPWKRQNLESLATAEEVYKVAYRYWTKAKEWSSKAWALRDVHLDAIENWQDENYRIETGDLDYKETIDRQLARLAQVRADFQKMDQNTY